MSRWPVRISQTGSGPTPPGDSQDRFAPKYLVGNTQAPYNDSAVGYNTDGFRYIPDPGDGSGIKAALSEAATTRGDVWIRPGTYYLDDDDLPYTIAGSVSVRGAGNTTVLRSNRAVFRMEVSSQISDLVITFNDREGSTGVDEYLIGVVQPGCEVRNLSIVHPLFDSQNSPRCAILLFGEAANSLVTENNIIIGDKDVSRPDMSAIWCKSSTSIVDRNTINTAGPSTLAAIIVGDPEFPFSNTARNVVVIGNAIDSAFSYGIWVAGECSDVNVSSNNIELSDGRARTSIYSNGLSTSIVGNAINQGNDLNFPQGPGILLSRSQLQGDEQYSVVSGNTVYVRSDEGSSFPAIQIESESNSCTGNACRSVGSVGSAVVLTATTRNCTAVSNVCGTVPPVDDQGSFNEVAHNT